MPLKPREKSSRIISLEEENSLQMLKDDTILIDQRKLKKLNMLDKIDEHLVKMTWALLNKKSSIRKGLLHVV